MNTSNTLAESYQLRVSRTLLLQSSVRSNRQRTKHLPCSSVWNHHMRTMQFFLTIWPPKWRLMSLRSEVLIQTTRCKTSARMMNCISGCQGAAGIAKMKVTKATSAILSPPPSGNDRPQLNPRGLTWDPVMSTGMRARMATHWKRMRRKKHHKPMMNQPRMWRTEGIEGLTWEPVMLMGIRARMVTMLLWLRRTNHRKPMMAQRRMWKTEGIVLESLTSGQFISDR